MTIANWMLWKWVRIERTFETRYDDTDGTTRTETVLVAEQVLRPLARLLPLDWRLGIATRRGEQDCRAGMKRSRVPLEYRSKERSREALSWVYGWSRVHEEHEKILPPAPPELDHSSWPKHIRDHIQSPGCNAAHSDGHLDEEIPW